MNDREKLIELLGEVQHCGVMYGSSVLHETNISNPGVADHLLASGHVIVPPVKVGDTVYGKDRKWTGTVEEIVINSDGIALYVSSGGHAFYAYPAVEELTFSEAALKEEE